MGIFFHHGLYHNLLVGLSRMRTQRLPLRKFTYYGYNVTQNIDKKNKIEKTMTLIGNLIAAEKKNEERCYCKIRENLS